MAEAADGKTCDIWASDLVPKRKEGEEENMYNMVDEPMDVLMFPFGKGVTTKLGWLQNFSLKPCIGVTNNFLVIDLQLHFQISCDGLQQKFQHA